MLLTSIVLSCMVLSADVTSHVGVYRGTARNAAGTLQLGNNSATTSVFQLETVKDSLYLKGNARGGTAIVLASWPLSRVESTKESIKAKGLSKGPLHHRRSLQWNISGGIRVSATIITNGASQPPDDFFGGSEVMLTLLKVR